MPREAVKAAAEGAAGGPPATADGDTAGRIDAAEPGTADGVRGRILAVARRLFAARGYDATSVREIAEGVGVTVPALYYHFGSKRGILVSLVDEHCSVKAAAVDAALRTGGTCAARLAAALRAYVSAMGRQTSAATVVMRDPSLSSDPELKGRVFSTERLVVDKITAVVRDGIEAGEFREVDPDRVALLLVTAARGVHVGRHLAGASGEAGSPIAGRIDPPIPEGAKAGATSAGTRGGAGPGAVSAGADEEAGSGADPLADTLIDLALNGLRSA